MDRKTFLIVNLVLALLMTAPVFAEGDGSGGGQVFPLNSVAYGQTYGEWAAAWWQWALSIPVATHPLFDNGDCSVGQSGPVVFLGGRFCSNLNPNPSCNAPTVTRTCTVPASKALFFPIFNVDDSTLEDPGKTIAELRAVPESVLNQATNLTAEVDGTAIKKLSQQFRVQSTAFGFTLPTDNLFTAIGEGPFAAGTYFPAVDEGVYLLLSPLRAGPHVIHFHAEVPAFGFVLDVTYKLTVSP